MGLGHVLLYPQRLQTALDAGPQKQRMDNALDGLLALMGTGAVGGAISEAFWERLALDRRAADYFGPWFAAGGPFAGIQAKVEGSFGDFDKGLLALIEMLKTTPPAAWRVVLQRRSEIALDVLAPIDLSALVTFLRRELEGLIDTLKRPVRNGPRSIEAHRALRVAVSIRRLLRPAFAILDDAEDALRDINLKGELRLALGKLFDLLQGANIERLQLAIRMFDETFGTVLRASASFRVDVSVSVDVGGPQHATLDTPTTRAEVQAVPNPKPDAIWVTDLVTNIFASFSMLWETIRTAPFAQRPLDGIMTLLGLVWQITRTVVRAGFADKINVALPEQGMPEFSFKNWVFTDQADFAMNMVWRLLGSLHEHHAPSNWYLSVMRRWMGYVSHFGQWRMPYQFARSLAYALALRKEAGEPDAAPSRLFFLALPVAWFVGIICAICVPWDDFQLENMSGAVIAAIVIVVVIFIIAMFVMPKIFIGRIPSARLDRLTNIVLGATAVLGALITMLLVGELEFKKDKAGLRTAIIVTLVIVMVLGAGFAVVTMFDNKVARSDFFYVQATLTGLLSAAVSFFLWYFYFDDGRDKPGVYAGLDADKSPFKLPYADGDNWLCGQGSHGIFSHYPVGWASAAMMNNSSDNHYAFDFNHIPRTPGLVSRDGFIMSFREDKVDDGDEPNSISILHSSWSAAVDPGADDERILTFADYFHISQGTMRFVPGDRVIQGNHLIDIDNNGRSAQHHLHLCSNANQGQVDGNGRKDTNVPLVFGDSSTHWFRNYPFLSFIPGKGHIPGKPLSMAYYVSSNAKTDALVNPRRVAMSTVTMPGATTDHHHDLLIDATILGSSTIPASVTLRTTIDQGHSHQVALTRDQIAALMSWQDVSGLTSGDTLGHSHVLDPLDHRRTPSTPAKAPNITIAQPSGAFVTATLPLPYAMAGSRWALRVDQAATEHHDHLAAPARFLADVAVDLGLASGEGLQAAGVLTAANPPSGRLGVRATAAAVALGWRAAAIAGSEARPTALAVPVLVVETRHGGSAVTLEATAATQLPLDGALPPLARGSGAVPNGSALTAADLAALITTGLTTGQPVTAGITLNKASLASRLGIVVSGAPATFSGGSSRLDRLLGLTYDSAASEIPSSGTLPLGPGRFGIAGRAIPVLGREANQRVVIAGDPFAAASLDTTPLVITLRGVAQEVWLTGSDTSAVAIARRVNAQAEGVRAWDDGADLIIETIDGGPDARIGITKAATGGVSLNLAVVAGESPNGNGLQSCSAMSLTVLARQIELAQIAATLPYDPAIISPSASVNGNRIEVTVAAGHTIEVEALALAGPTSAFAFSAAPPTPGTKVQTEPVTGPVALLGAGWVDFKIDGAQRVRIPLDTERARLELPPMARLPVAGERLVIAIDGGAPVTVGFTGNETSLAAVAEAVAVALPGCTVRIAHRLAINDAFWGEPTPAVPPVTLTDSNGIKQMGFLRPLAVGSSGRIGFLDSSGQARDGLALRGDSLSVSAAWKFAAPPTFNGDIDGTIISTTDGGNGAAFTLNAASGWQISCQPDVGGDPFGFATGVTGATVTSSLGGATFAWGGTALRHRLRATHSASGRTGGSIISLHALPATLRGVRAAAPMIAPTRTFTIEVQPPGGAARAHGVDLAGINLDDLDRVAAAINAAVPGVRCWVVQSDSAINAGGTGVQLLHIETVGSGSGWRLRASPLDLAGLLGLPVERAGAAASLEASGAGDVADANAVTRAEIKAALDRAARLMTVNNVPAVPGFQASDKTTAAAKADAYEARPSDAGVDLFLRLRSQRSGAASSLQVLEHGGRGPAFPTDPVQSPACRAAIVIPPIAGNVTLNGDLPIEFNEAPPGSVVLAPTLVTVNFPNGSYSAAQIAARIDAAVAAVGTGRARLFPDGAIVVETSRDGLLGAVTFPAPGPTRAVADALIGVGQSLSQRGWPDIGRPAVGSDLLNGFCSRRGAAKAAATWAFTDGTTTISIAVAVDDTPDQLAEKLNQQFATTAPVIGAAAFVDGMLFVESLNAKSLTLQVNGMALGMVNPDQDRPWLTPEHVSEPACDLRLTNEIRTVRTTRGQGPALDPAALDDWGWLRHPLDSGKGTVLPFFFLPRGRFGLDLRSDGGKPSSHDPLTARVASADPVSNLVHAVRFGIAVKDGSPWGFVRLRDGSLVEEWTMT